MSDILRAAAIRKAQQQAAQQSNLATGTQSSQEGSNHSTKGPDPVPEKKEKDNEKEEKDAPVGGYKALRLQRFMKANGEVVLPINGYFVPKDQEEFDMLEYYAKNDMLVKAPADGKKL